MKLFKKTLILGLVVLLNLGCSKDKYHADATIVQDGKVYSVYPYELDENITEEKQIKNILEALNFNYTYISSNEKVDLNIYNFLTVIPIKSDVNLKYAFSKFDKSYEFIYAYPRYAISFNSVKYADGYYHYKLYGASNYLATKYLLNDIKDFTIEKMDYKLNTMDKDILLTSNDLTIPAEEFEEMLERLAISHERLAFQPEGY